MIAKRGNKLPQPETMSVTHWREELDKAPPGSLLRALGDAWPKWVNVTAADLDLFRRVEARNNNPLASVTLLAKSGLYPPPELLLTLAARYDLYMKANADGYMDLETALIGAPKQRAGNWGKKVARRWRLAKQVFVVGRAEATGQTQTKGAEKAADHYGGDPASIARYYRTLKKSVEKNKRK